MDINLTHLYHGLFRDMSISENDCKYVLRRLASEGIKFATQELPKVSKAVINGLEIGYFDRSELTSFRFKRSTLELFHVLLSSIFDSKSGILLSSPDPESIRVIRQCCEYLYKLALPFTDEQIKKAEDSFLEVDKEVLEVAIKPETIAFANDLRKDFETHWRALSTPTADKILGSNRPRSTSGTFVGSDSMYFAYRESESRSGYPSDLGAYKGYFKQYPGIKSYSNFNPITVGSYSELLLVPKDSRGPRTICRENLHRVETQMAFFDYVTRVLTRESNGAINFLDQTVNRRIAEESSVTKRYATLDLKEASDRVSYITMKKIFENSPGMRFFLTGSRRASEVLVRGSFHQLNKLAGMGSGLTFPSMSLLISLAVCNIVSKHVDLPYDRIRSDVFIYGDDICIPCEWVPFAVEGLHKIGLRVNLNKSFFRGSFRESCGGDYVAGYNVVPVRMRLSNSNPNYIVSRGIVISNNANAFKQLYEHCKELMKYGLTNTSKYIMSVLNAFYKESFGQNMLPGPFDEKVDLPLNFHLGTRHLNPDESTVIRSIRPERIRDVYNRKIVTRKGTVLTIDPRRALGRFLANGVRTHVSEKHQGGACTVRSFMTASSMKRQLALRDSGGIEIESGSLTVPRNLTFVKKEVYHHDIIDFSGYSREDFHRKYTHNCALQNLALVLCALSNAHITVAKYHSQIASAKLLSGVAH